MASMQNCSLCRHAGIVRRLTEAPMFATKTMRVAISLLAALGTLAGCHRSAAQGGATPSVKLGSYRVVLQTPGGELPFGLDLLQKDSQVIGYLVNGQERLLLREVNITGSHLEIRMPGYENVLTADAAGDQLKGEIFLVKLGGKNQHVPLR